MLAERDGRQNGNRPPARSSMIQIARRRHRVRSYISMARLSPYQSALSRVFILSTCRRATSRRVLFITSVARWRFRAERKNPSYAFRENVEPFLFFSRSDDGGSRQFSLGWNLHYSARMKIRIRKIFKLKESVATFRGKREIQLNFLAQLTCEGNRDKFPFNSWKFIILTWMSISILIICNINEL